MRKIFVFILCVFIGYEVFAQSTDTITVTPKPQPLTQIQRDSLLMSISEYARTIAHPKIGLKNSVGRYKMYRTTNIYNNLKLDTATGEIVAVQIGIDDSSSRFEYIVCKEIDDSIFIIGRYELYPTGNNHNFILLDTVLGITYQVQWSTKQKECFRVMIY